MELKTSHRHNILTFKNSFGAPTNGWSIGAAN